jgi:hypothetical protein
MLVGSAWILSFCFSVPIAIFYEEKKIQGTAFLRSFGAGFNASVECTDQATRSADTTDVEPRISETDSADRLRPLKVVYVICRGFYGN